MHTFTLFGVMDLVTVTFHWPPVRNSLLWRHNERDGVSNCQPYDCLLNRLFRRRSKEKSQLCVTGLWVGNSHVTCEFPAQRASNTENVSIWWRHHVSQKYLLDPVYLALYNMICYQNIWSKCCIELHDNFPFQDQQKYYTRFWRNDSWILNPLVCVFRRRLTNNRFDVEIGRLTTHMASLQDVDGSL